MRCMKRLVFRALLLVFVYAFLEAACLAGLHLLSTLRHVNFSPVNTCTLLPRHQKAIRDLLADRSRYIAFSPALGWTVKPGGASDLYRANDQGLRADRNYDLAPAEGVLRILAFGDSFTHANGVPNAQTWEARLEAMDPGLEVLNFGVPGYGLDQALLRIVVMARRQLGDLGVHAAERLELGREGQTAVVRVVQGHDTQGVTGQEEPVCPGDREGEVTVQAPDKAGPSLLVGLLNGFQRRCGSGAEIIPVVDLSVEHDRSVVFALHDAILRFGPDLTECCGFGFDDSVATGASMIDGCERFFDY